MKIKGTCNKGTLYRKTKGGVWYMRFTEYAPDGKRKRVVFSTGTTDEDAAKVALAERARKMGYATSEERHVEAVLEIGRNIENERLRMEKERAEAEAKRRAEAEAAAKIESERRAITIEAAFSYYRASKKRPDSGERTLKGYETQFGIFARWVAEKFPAAVKMRDFTPEMAEKFLDHLEKTRSRNTRNKYLVFLRTLWRVLRWEADAQLTVDPWDGIRTLVQNDRVKHKDLTVDELRRVVAVIRSGEPLPAPRREGSAAGGIKDVFTFNGQGIRGELLLLFAVGIYTGLRLGDCAALQWGQVDTALGIIRIMPRKTARRWEQEITIPIHPTLGALLVNVAAAGIGTGYVMPTLADIYLRREPSMLTNRIQAIFRAAGLETTATAPTSGDKARTKVGFHSCRHFFAAWLDNHNTNHALTNYLTCHEQGKVQATYYHDNAAALRQAVGTLPPLPLLDGGEQGAIEAPTAAPAEVPAIIQAEATDAPCALLAAIRANLDGATAEDLNAAIEIIQTAIGQRAGEI